MDLEKYNEKDATHNLRCRHCTSPKSCFDYDMPCIILKKLPKNRFKILVFGDRYWKGKDDKKRIRYVDDFRVRQKRLTV